MCECLQRGGQAVVGGEHFTQHDTILDREHRIARARYTGSPDTLTRVSRSRRIRHRQAAHPRSDAVGAYDEIVGTTAAVAENYTDLPGIVFNILNRRTVPNDGAQCFGGVEENSE